MHKARQLTVVMPVHNALPYLDQAIESILSQTHGDFEFVILDDASTDGSRKRLREWARKDERIRLIESERNLGPALSSETVARAALTPIVARMDADDLSHPRRLEEQLKVLNEHRDVGVIGGLWEVIDAKGRVVRKAEPWRLALPSVFPPFGHGPMMYRREVFEAAGGYRSKCEFWEDADLLFRMAAVSKVMVIPHAVYQVRQSPVSTRVLTDQARIERAFDQMYRAKRRLQQGLGYDDLLGESAPKDEKLDPRVFTSAGAIVLWAGRRPRLFRRLLERGHLALNMRTTSALIWTGWASLHPSSLRTFSRCIVFVRNVFASVAAPGDSPQCWAPSSGSLLKPPDHREGTVQAQGPPGESLPR